MESCYVSEDVVMDILSRLPVRTLMRSKCVCKSWCDFISSPFFIQKHLLLRQCQSTTRSKENCLLFIGQYCTKQQIGANILVSSAETVDDHKSANLDIPIFHVYRYPDLIGSCNGIVCLTDHCGFHYRGEGITMLWNPATREFKTLPQSLHAAYPSAENPSYSACMGFGFDAKTNDYKVVRIASCKIEMSLIPPLAEVYSLSTNSWKAKVGLAPSLGFRSCDSCEGTYLNGVYYWWAIGADGVDVLLSFDMANEVFQKTPLPDCYDWKNLGIGRNLMGLKGSLALVVYGRADCWKLLDIWVIDIHAKDCSLTWVRPLSIAAHCISRPLGFWLNDEEFLLHTGTYGKPYGNNVLSYNLKSQVIRDLRADYGLPCSISSSLLCALYTESLVSLKTGP